MKKNFNLTKFEIKKNKLFVYASLEKSKKPTNVTGAGINLENKRINQKELYLFLKNLFSNWNGKDSIAKALKLYLKDKEMQKTQNLTEAVKAKKQIVIILSAPAGSGKDYTANKIMDKFNGEVKFKLISSDKIREDLFGDESINKRGDLVFKTFEKLFEKELINGNSIICNATFLKPKARSFLINILKRYKSKKPNLWVQTIDISTNLPTCIYLDSLRERHVPVDVIARMNIQHIPFSKRTSEKEVEIIDSYEIINNKIKSESYAEEKEINSIKQFLKNPSAENTLNCLKNIPELIPNLNCEQTSKWHLEDLETHIKMVVDKYNILVPDELKNNNLLLSCLYHDIGKPFTKFWNKKTNGFSFYGHEKLGSELFEKISVPKLNKHFPDLDTSLISSLIKDHLVINLIKFENGEIGKIPNTLSDKSNEYLINLFFLSLSDSYGRVPEERTQFGNTKLKMEFLYEYFFGGKLNINIQ